MAKSPEEMTASMIANMKEKTGKTLEQWLKIVKSAQKSEGLAKHGEIVKHLKAEHGMTHGFANLAAHKALESDAGSAESGDSLIEAQYAGPKTDLRPIYDKLIKAVQGFGADVEIAPKKTSVSLRRKQAVCTYHPCDKDPHRSWIGVKGGRARWAA